MEDISQAPQVPFDWESAATTAGTAVEALIARLPDELRPEALALSIDLCERSADPDQQDWLGSYSRSAQLIELYLKVIHEYCVENSVNFQRQIEITYLHELGHHLGLGEQALLDRGL